VQRGCCVVCCPSLWWTGVNPLPRFCGGRRGIPAAQSHPTRTPSTSASTADDPPLGGGLPHSHCVPPAHPHTAAAADHLNDPAAPAAGDESPAGPTLGTPDHLLGLSVTHPI